MVTLTTALVQLLQHSVGVLEGLEGHLGVVLAQGLVNGHDGGMNWREEGAARPTCAHMYMYIHVYVTVDPQCVIGCLGANKSLQTCIP